MDFSKITKLKGEICFGIWRRFCALILAGLFGAVIVLTAITVMTS